MRGHTTDRLAHAGFTLRTSLDAGTPDTPRDTHLSLVDEPSKLSLPLSQVFERVLQDASMTAWALGQHCASSSRAKRKNAPLMAYVDFSRYLRLAHEMRFEARERRELLRLERSRNSVYSLMAANNRRLSRSGAVKCR